MITDLQIATAQLSELANGFLGVQVDGNGDDAAVTTFQLHHPFGFISRPRDPDARGSGCSVLYGYEGDLGHAWLLGDPRYTPSLPATKAGGSVQYCVTSTGAVSYASFDGDDGSYKLHTPNAHVDISDPSGSAVVGNVSAAQNVMLAPDLLTWIGQVNAYMAAINAAIASIPVAGTADLVTGAVIGTAIAVPPALPSAVPIQTVTLKASPNP